MYLVDYLVKGTTQPKTITPHAVGANWRPISNRPGEVYCSRRRPDRAKGAAYLANHAGFQLTDCTIFVRNVVAWAYRQIGDTTAANKVAGLGLGIPEWLIKERNWKGIYWNCDVARPRDGDVDHVDTYISVKKNGRYQPPGKWKIDVKVDAVVVQFKPTLPGIQSRHYKSRLTDPDKGNLPLPTESPDLLRKLKRARFGVILGKSGDHNALLHVGKVYDVNYCVGPDSPYLYGRSDFEKWADTWCSGVVVVPPGEW